jgi:hypothetical protein
VLSSGYLFVGLKMADFKGHKLRSIQYLLKAIVFWPSILLKRNFYVAQKKLFFRWHSSQ